MKAPIARDNPQLYHLVSYTFFCVPTYFLHYSPLSLICPPRLTVSFLRAGTVLPSYASMVFCGKKSSPSPEGLCWGNWQKCSLVQGWVDGGAVVSQSTVVGC